MSQSLLRTENLILALTTLYFVVSAIKFCLDGPSPETHTPPIASWLGRRLWQGYTTACVLVTVSLICEALSCALGTWFVNPRVPRNHPTGVGDLEASTPPPIPLTVAPPVDAPNPELKASVNEDDLELSTPAKTVVFLCTTFSGVSCLVAQGVISPRTTTLENVVAVVLSLIHGSGTLGVLAGAAVLVGRAVLWVQRESDREAGVSAFVGVKEESILDGEAPRDKKEGVV